MAFSESRLLNYLIAYILVQRNIKHVQPTINDLKLMFAIREGIFVNWLAEILKVMYGIASSSTRLVAYGIFISRIIASRTFSTATPIPFRCVSLYVYPNTNRPPRKFRIVRNQDEGGSSSGAGRYPSLRGDPFYAPTVQARSLAKVVNYKITYIRYNEMVWMLEQGFEFSHGLEAQGVNTFLQLNSKIYLSLVREFYANFQFKDGKYLSVVKGKLFSLDESFFLEVGGWTCDRSPLGDCSDELWNSYDTIELYKSCLRGNHHYVQGYVRNCFFFIKLLAYRIFFSCVIDHLGIETLGVETMVVYSIGHLVGDNLVHMMGIYKYGAMWKYQEDHNTTVNIDDLGEQHPE
ncbi:hypothetical protein Lal_00042980 [Lupinus albus]|nr:hypothetical protein Lal_00042980 [Lupinus albus]